jgi:hypothetical protein
MTDMTVTIDLERFISTDDLEDNVIRQLAATCESKLSGGHTDSFHKMCVAAIEKAISERIEARIAELIDKPIIPRDRFGVADEGAEAKSLGDMLAEAVETACTETVNRDGKPAKNTNWEKAIPRIQWHLSKLVASEIDREAANAIKELKADAKQRVRDQRRRSRARQAGLDAPE